MDDLELKIASLVLDGEEEEAREEAAGVEVA